MSTRHYIGYSKSTRAKCHMPPFCTQGVPLPVGTLRYGKGISSEIGETLEWRHWGCVTPSTLTELAGVGLDSIEGFEDLRPNDKQRVRQAITTRRIDPVDMRRSGDHNNKSTLVARSASTSSGQVIVPPATTGARTARKRKAGVKSVPVSQANSQVTELISSEMNEEEPKDELFSTMHTNVVGIQYYNGLVGENEEVILVREPANRYDRNAIQVKNIGQTQVGHIPRDVASKLAPLLDKDLIAVEGVIHDGNLSGRRLYSLSITLKFYSQASRRSEVEPLLAWAAPGQRGYAPRNAGRSSAGSYRSVWGAAPTPQARAGPSSRPAQNTVQSPEIAKKREIELRNAAELQQIISGLERVSDESRRGSLLDSLCSTVDILELPVHPDPPGIKNGQLRVDLLKHQSQALQWAIKHEYPELPQKESDEPVQFWQFRKHGNKPYYYNIVTKTPQDNPPTLGRGALCADAMGLGKTLMMISLILTTKEDRPKEDFVNSTLIVVPLSVLSNWEKQLQDHCTPGSLTSYVYYGSNRSLSAQELSSFDVVITTYQTVTGEHPESGESGSKKVKLERPLFTLKWKRIVLDEGHTIRNQKTKAAQAACALQAQRRWVLTGTPIINSPRDLGSLLSFLKICKPLDNDDFFTRLLLRPLKAGRTEGAELLRALMTHVCIRRTKEMQDNKGNPLILLPPVEMILVPVALDEESRKFYEDVEKASQQCFRSLIEGDNRALIQGNALSMLTRLRQLALHPALVPRGYLESLQSGTQSSPIGQTAVTPEEKARLQSILAQAIEDYQECPICFNRLGDARITSCAHCFCFACIIEVMSRAPKCPMDRRPLTMADLFEPPPAELTQIFPSREDSLETQSMSPSAKINQLILLLRLTAPGEKSLVFSQFTSFLDKIGDVLEAEKIPYIRFDGSLSSKRREEVIHCFSVPLQDKPGRWDLEDSEDEDQVNPQVMLISLKAGALGLNLTVANNVYLMDPWWQEGIESQAIDRVNRIGQQKNVHVYQLIAENTVESKVMEIQNRKKRMIKEAFSGIKSKETERERREARLQDLIELFGMRRQGNQ